MYTSQEKKNAQHRKWKNASRQRAQGRVLSYLKTHPCVDCGITNPLVLDFDHRNPEEKYMGISDMVTRGYAISKIEIEIAKCDIRCANCHRQKHLGDCNWRKVFITPSVRREYSLESREKIRQSKLGKPRSEETKARISVSLQGNHCRKIIDLTGKMFGRLWVAGQGEKSKGRIHWICWCACGNTCSVAGIKLTTNSTKSCGCLLKEFYGNQHTPITEGPRDTRAKRNSGAMGQATLQACSLD